jgi:hypothetical protein
MMMIRHRAHSIGLRLMSIIPAGVAAAGHKLDICQQYQTLPAGSFVTDSNALDTDLYLESAQAFFVPVPCWRIGAARI